MSKRIAVIKRKTKETDIKGKLIIDGTGKTDIKTGIGFLDHMLTLFAFHGLFDLTLKAKGDLGVDIHHTNEDIGICLGKAFKDVLGDCKGIKRFGSAEVPMDEASAKVMIDIGGRYAFDMRPASVGASPVDRESVDYTIGQVEDFLKSFAKNLDINLKISFDASGSDTHHTLEAIFKAFGIALDQATQIEPRRKNQIPSTKGRI